jgi:hypothetical protein
MSNKTTFKTLTGKIPFQEYRPVQLIRTFIKGTIVPLQPGITPNIAYASEVWSLAEMCLRHDPRKRPTVDETLKLVLCLKVKDERPPVAADPKIFVKRSRSAVEFDYDALASIIQQVRTTHQYHFFLCLRSAGSTEPIKHLPFHILKKGSVSPLWICFCDVSCRKLFMMLFCSM